MRRLFDDIFADQAEGKDRPVTGLNDWGTWGDPDISFECYQAWELSHFVVLPYPGAWLDQPRWVRRDFIHWLRVKHWHEQQARRPDTSTLPRLDTI